MTEKIKISIDGKKYVVQKGSKLMEQFPLDMPCSGHGKCGKCKIRVLGAVSPVTEIEHNKLTAEELQNGVRLACCTEITGKCEIQTLWNTNSLSQIVTQGLRPISAIVPTFVNYGVAIDIGTTTLVAQLYNAEGYLLSEECCLNPQVCYGADVLSRIEASVKSGSKEVTECIREAVDSCILSLCDKAGIKSEMIDGVVITGNTAMLYLLTGTDATPLTRAPFHARELFDKVITVDGIGITSLKKETEVYFPPCISAFVGADTVCAMMAVELAKNVDAAILIDLGTNGEIALWNHGQLSVCATAAGPVFEGGEISAGMRASTGAIDRVWIEGNKLAIHVIGETAPVGICGSGLIDAAACLLELGALDESGLLESNSTAITKAVTITQRDVRMLQAAKSAIYAGIITLTAKAGISVEQISSVYIAGGLGKYLNATNGARIGLIPEEVISKIKVVGNVALSGAAMLLLNRHTRVICQEISKSSRTIDLATDRIFREQYIMGMPF